MIKNNNLDIRIGVALFTIFLFDSCYYDSKQNLMGGTLSCDTSNVMFATTIQPILTQSCTSCHGGISPSANISLEGYANVKLYSNQLLTSIQNGTMPKGSAKLDDCTIQKVQVWINQGALNN